LAVGRQSPYLRQPSVKEVKALTGQRLLDLFSELQTYDCDLFYCGRHPAQYVATVAQQLLPLSRCRQPRQLVPRKVVGYEQPTVFFYHVPKSRQNYVVTYQQLPPAPTGKDRVVQQLWDQYVGGGMSSVLFQNIREFQSLAYSTQGVSIVPPLPRQSNDSLAYLTITGTQADKTPQAMHVLDSLMRDLPISEENLEAARQEMLSDVQNDSPSFRTIAETIARMQDNGFTEDANAPIVRYAAEVTRQEVTDYHSRHVAPCNRVWLIIGDRKQTDFSVLAKYGKVVELRKEDVFR
jgi:predicted Zn-dependent peptidase